MSQEYGEKVVSRITTALGIYVIYPRLFFPTFINKQILSSVYSAFCVFLYEFLLVPISN